MTHTSPYPKQFRCFLLPLCFFVNISFCSNSVCAQGGQSSAPEKEEEAWCKVKVNNNEYILKANKEGFFPQVSNFQPSTVVPIIVTYPQGIPGEKIILSAEDGGSFDNKKKAMTYFLNAEKNFVFNFHFTQNDGVFEIILRKGQDAKVIQLWVGEE
jgi:hypothetical protein